MDERLGLVAVFVFTKASETQELDGEVRALSPSDGGLL
jgi:hypothetical protein